MKVKVAWGLLGFILLIIILSFFFGQNKIMGRRMEPTFNNQTYLITRKIIFGQPKLRRGNVILFKEASFRALRISRVIALPNELIRFYNGNLYIKTANSAYKVTESYLPKETKTLLNTENGNSPDWINVGELSYFTLPDNRTERFNIEEQRVNINNIEGVVIF